MTFKTFTSAELFEHIILGDCGVLDDERLNLHAVASAADDHGVAALVWQALDSRPGRAASLRSILDASVRASVTRDLVVQREMQTVLDGLHAESARAILFKGSALAYTVYPLPWLRPRTDTDILVAGDDLAAATRALENCGYCQCHGISTGQVVSYQIPFERTDAHGVYHVVDLHWKIANPQMVADAVPFDLLWGSSQPAALLGRNARVPSPAASVIAACIHRLAHHQGHDRLIWLYDLKLLCERLDRAAWAGLTQLAAARGVAALCLDGLQQARDRLGATLPVDAELALASAGAAETSRTYLDGRVSRRDVLVSDLTLLRSWRDRIRLLREHAFPPAAFIRQRYRTSARWLLPAFYVHRLVTGAVKWVRP